MSWYNFLDNAIDKAVAEKTAIFYSDSTPVQSNERVFAYQEYYEKIEVVQRSVNMIIDDVSEIPTNVGDQSKVTGVVKNIRKTKVDKLLNYEANIFQDISTFKRNAITDILLDGNIFIYFDGMFMYHLQAEKVKIIPDVKNHVKYYEYDIGEGSKKNYLPREIIHIKENSFKSIYRGVPRLKSALRTMQLLNSMRSFQDNFFQNGAVPGLVIKTPNTLSERIKQRMVVAWVNQYNPSSGGRRPLILDGGTELDTIANVNFKELDFQPSIESNEKTVLKAMGVPPILLDSGNNANIRPNLRLYYLETILPIVIKMNAAFERYFGFALKPELTDIPALQPELSDSANYWSTIVNGGIAYVNEARVGLGMPLDEDETSNQLRIPANIAGSAVDPSQGGKPPEEEEE